MCCLRYVHPLLFSSFNVGVFQWPLLLLKIFMAWHPHTCWTALTSLSPQPHCSAKAIKAVWLECNQKRSFYVAALMLWNSLPESLWKMTSLQEFRKRRKADILPAGLWMLRNAILPTYATKTYYMVNIYKVPLSELLLIALPLIIYVKYFIITCAINLLVLHWCHSGLIWREEPHRND